METQSIPVEISPSKPSTELTLPVRRMFIADLQSTIGFKAVGEGFGALLMVSFVGCALINGLGWSNNLYGLPVLWGCAIGVAAFLQRRQISIAEINEHDDQMLRVLFDRYERQKQTLIICTSILLGAAAIAFSIVATKLWR